MHAVNTLCENKIACNCMTSGSVGIMTAYTLTTKHSQAERKLITVCMSTSSTSVRACMHARVCVSITCDD